MDPSQMKRVGERYRAFLDPILLILMIVFLSTTQISALIGMIMCFMILFALNFSIEMLGEEMNLIQGVEDPLLWTIDFATGSASCFDASRCAPAYQNKEGRPDMGD